MNECLKKKNQDDEVQPVIIWLCPKPFRVKMSDRKAIQMLITQNFLQIEVLRDLKIP